MKPGRCRGSLAQSRKGWKEAKWGGPSHACEDEVKSWIPSEGEGESEDKSGTQRRAFYNFTREAAEKMRGNTGERMRRALALWLVSASELQ